jgi:hypothetical protein
MLAQKIQIGAYPARQGSRTTIDTPDNLGITWIIIVQNRHKSARFNILLHMKTANTAQA